MNLEKKITFTARKITSRETEKCNEYRKELEIMKKNITPTRQRHPKLQIGKKPYAAAAIHKKEKKTGLDKEREKKLQ